MTFRPLVRVGRIAAVPLCTLLTDALGGRGPFLLLVCEAALLWLGFVGYEEHMRITAGRVRLESRLAGRTVRSTAMCFADIKSPLK